MTATKPADLQCAITMATKAAMRARQRDRVKALRLVNAAVKQARIDSGRPLAEADVVAVLTRMRKQRRDSLAQFTAAGRDDLAAIERFEIDVIEEFMPRAPSADEIDAAVRAAVAATGAGSRRERPPPRTRPPVADRGLGPRKHLRGDRRSSGKPVHDVHAE